MIAVSKSDWKLFQERITCLHRTGCDPEDRDEKKQYKEWAKWMGWTGKMTPSEKVK